MVGERGFEPPTHWSQTSCATKLRYSPMGAHITALLKKRQCLLLKNQLIAWKASSGQQPQKNHSALAGAAAGAEHQLFASLIPPSGEV